MAVVALWAATGVVGVGTGPAGAVDVVSTSLGTFSGSTASMVDGDLATSWKSVGGPTTSDWVRLDKGAVVAVSRVDLWMTAAGSTGDRIELGLIEVSSDGSSWTALGAFTNTDEVHMAAPAGTTARYVRARPTTNQNLWLVVREFSTAATGTPPATPPGQPVSGPGGSTYPHGSYTVTAGGSGHDAWYVFEPAEPTPATAPLAIVTHGYGEFAGWDSMARLVEHTVRAGSVVVYPRYQTGLLDPFGFEPALEAAHQGIAGGLAHLQADPTRVRPQLDRANYLGFSYGGVITANLANRHATLGLPAPRSLMLVEPHDGFVENDVDDSMSGIPSTTIVTCWVSDDVRPGDPSGCKTIFPLLGHIPNDRKDYVTFYDDAHGWPGLVASHQAICSPFPGAAVDGACGTAPDQTRTDAADFAFWKAWVAQQHCANTASDCPTALGDTAAHRDRGLWSDGVAVRPLRISGTPTPP